MIPLLISMNLSLTQIQPPPLHFFSTQLSASSESGEGASGTTTETTEPISKQPKPKRVVPRRNTPGKDNQETQQTQGGNDNIESPKPKPSSGSGG
jgi:hypothetical protein